MGFSVSGSAAIIFAGMFLGFGIFYGAASNSFERISEAETEQTDRIVDKRNTALNITLAEYDSNTNRVTVHVNNTGTTPQSLNDTDFIVDNEYIAGWQADARVLREDGTVDTQTDLWLPGERLNITITDSDLPARAKVVTESGVSASTGGFS